MKTTLLIKTRLKAAGFLSTAVFRDLKEKDRLWLLPLAAAGVAAGAAAFLYMLLQNYRLILMISINEGRPELLIFTALTAGAVLIFFAGTPIALSSLFYSSDNRMLIALPLPAADIALSRAAVLYLFMLPLHLYICIPAYVLYFGACRPSLLSAVSAAAVLLLGPVIPVCLAVLASILLVKFADISGHKTAFEIAGMTAAVLAILFLQTAFMRIQTGSADITAAAGTITRYISEAEKIFPAAAWAAAAHKAGGFPYFMLFVSASAAAAAAGTALAGISIRTDLTDRPEDSAGKKRRKSGGLVPGRQPAFKALLKREWIIIKSSSTFLFEIAGEAVILPLLLGVFSLTMPEGYIGMIRSTLEGFPALPLAAFGIIILMTSVNSVSCTSISREGRSFMLSKSLPVSPAEQVKAKMIFHLIIFGSAWLLDLAILCILLKPAFIYAVLYLAGAPVFILLNFAATFYIDLNRPVLNWSHPQQAMKQNLNVPIGMGLSLAPPAAAAAVAVPLYSAGVHPAVILSLVTAAGAAAAFVLLKKVFRSAERRYPEIIPEF